MRPKAIEQRKNMEELKKIEFRIEVPGGIL
jgi:hypothetical protein